MASKAVLIVAGSTLVASSAFAAGFDINVGQDQLADISSGTVSTDDCTQGLLLDIQRGDYNTAEDTWAVTGVRVSAAGATALGVLCDGFEVTASIDTAGAGVSTLTHTVEAGDTEVALPLLVTEPVTQLWVDDVVDVRVLVDEPNLVAALSSGIFDASTAGVQLVGTASWSDASSGVCGPAAVLGSDGHATLPGRPLGDFSVSTWAKRTGAENPGEPIFNLASDTVPPFPFEIRAFILTTSNVGTAMRIPVSGSWPNAVNTVETIANDTWHHLVVTHDKGGDGTRLYLDGVLIGSNAYNASSLEDTPGANFLIGASAWAGDPTFNGEIDEFQIFDRAITPTEVASLHSSPCSSI